MKYAKLFLFLFMMLAAGAVGAYAQDGPPPEDSERGERPEDHRPNLLAELGLSREQIQQIRRANRERRPVMMNARRRMGEAARNLDMAIYGDAVSDTDVHSRLKEFQAAESELSRLRFESELAVRKILTPEQLVRFRDLRRRFAEERRRNNPARRMQRRDQQMPPTQD